MVEAEKKKKKPPPLKCLLFQELQKLPLSIKARITVLIGTEDGVE